MLNSKLILKYIDLLVNLYNNSSKNNWKILENNKTFIILKDLKASQLLGISLKSVKNFKSFLKNSGAIQIINKFTVFTNIDKYRNLNTLITINISKLKSIYTQIIQNNGGKTQGYEQSFNKLLKNSNNANIYKWTRLDKNQQFLTKDIKKIFEKNNIKFTKKDIKHLITLHTKDKKAFNQALEKTILRKECSFYVGSTVSPLINPIGYLIKMFNVFNLKYRTLLKQRETIKIKRYLSSISKINENDTYFYKNFYSPLLS